MSMWEIEALGEESVILVHGASLPRAEKRNLIGAIYAEIGQWDTSFIHFRTLDQLRELEFFFSLPPSEHPDYATRRAQIEAKAADRGGWLSDPETGESEAILTSAGGDAPMLLWFDPSHALWRKMVESGRLTGLAAQPLTPMDKVGLITLLMGMADGLEDRSKARALLKLYHGYMAYDARPDILDPDDPRLQRARAQPGLKEALNTPSLVPNDWIEERFDARDALAYIEDPATKAAVEWWCAPYDILEKE